MVEANASLVYGFSTHEMLREVLPYIDRPLGGCASVLVEDRCMAASRQVRTHLGNTSAATSLLCSGRSVGYWVDASSLVGTPCKAWCSSECRYRDFNVSSDAVELRKCLSRRWIHVAGDSTARGVFQGLQGLLHMHDADWAMCKLNNVSHEDPTGRRARGVLDDCTSHVVPGLRATFMSRDTLWRMPKTMANLTSEHHLNNGYLRSWKGGAQPDVFVYNSGLHEVISTWGGEQANAFNMSRIVHDAAAFLRLLLDDADGPRYRGRLVWFKGHHIKVGRRAKGDAYPRIVSFYDAMQNVVGEMFAARGAVVSDLWQTTQFSDYYDSVGVHYSRLKQLHANILLNAICNGIDQT